MSELYLFKGCLIPTRLPFLERSCSYLIERLGIDMEPLPKASCCVEPIGLRSMSRDGWLAVAGRMLAIAERGGKDLLTVCNGCFMSLKEAEAMLREGERREEVNGILSELGLEYRGGVRVIHLMELLDDRIDEISSLCDRPQGSRFAIHTGCHMIRPSRRLELDRPYSPRILADLVSEVGGEVVHNPDWPPCCGGGLTGVDDGISTSILDEIVQRYRATGAQAIVTPCPFCFVQFDIRQRDGLPVLHISELLALALGADPEAIGLQYHRTRLGP